MSAILILQAVIAQLPSDHASAQAHCLACLPEQQEHVLALSRCLLCSGLSEGLSNYTFHEAQRMAKVNDTDKHHKRSDCSIFPLTHANITNCVRLWPGFLPACFEELSAGWRGPLADS